MVVRLIEAVASDSVKLQYDIYHMQVMEGGLIRSLGSLGGFKQYR